MITEVILGALVGATLAHIDNKKASEEALRKFFEERPDSAELARIKEATRNIFGDKS